MWIDRIITEQPEGPDSLDLHPRLTVIASPDHKRRLEAFQKIRAALEGRPGSHLHGRTETGFDVVAQRPAGQAATLIDPSRQIPWPDSDRAHLGLAGLLDDPAAMTNHLRVLHASKENLVRRLSTDRDMIAMARAPIDQLCRVASDIQRDTDTLSLTQEQETERSAAAAERASRVSEVHEFLEHKEVADRKRMLLIFGAVVALALGALVGVSGQMLLAAPLVFGSGVLGVMAARLSKCQELAAGNDAYEEEFGGTELGLQLGRLDEMFDTHSLSRRRTDARKNLEQSRRIWQEIAGDVDPALLVSERSRLEELAGHLRVIDNEEIDDGDDASRQLLIGFAATLAEISRRFPVERVPVLVDDLFAHVTPPWHPALRELLTRAAHRRQVIVESANFETAQWAATEAVAGNGLLITDQDVRALHGVADGGSTQHPAV